MLGKVITKLKNGIENRCFDNPRALICSRFILLNFVIPEVYDRESIFYSHQLSTKPKDNNHHREHRGANCRIK